MTKIAPISDKGLELIQTFEGFRPLATLLSNGIWVIGHGHTASAKKGGIVSELDAKNLLLWDMGNLAPQVKANIFAPVSQPQMDALLSLAFNIGIDNFTKSDVVRFINEGKVLSAAAAFDSWRKASLGGREIVVDALVRRRTAEKAMFLNVEEGVVLAPSFLLEAHKDIELERRVCDDAEEQAAKSPAKEVAIDLANSAALGSLLGETNVFEDGSSLVSNSEQNDKPDFHFSDDDLEAVANANEPQIEKTSEEDEVKATGTDELIPIGDVFQTQSNKDPVREQAEQISDRMSEIGVAVTADEPSSDPALIAEQQAELADDVPPMPEQEIVARDEGNEVVQVSDEYAQVEDVLTLDHVQGDFPPFVEHEEPTPENLSIELPEQNEQPFEVLEKRNSGMFILMAIAGLIFIAGGVYGIQQAGVIVTLEDMIKGPALAGTGILLSLVSVYFLLTKAKK